MKVQSQNATVLSKITVGDESVPILQLFCNFNDVIVYNNPRSLIVN